MEPMALGSPSSPGNSSSYLPSFLMGEPMTPPRTTTLSPTKIGGRSLAFGQSPNSPKDTLNRSSAFHNRNPLSPSVSGSVFANQQQHHHHHLHHHGGSSQNLNSSVSGGPPTQGLFDSLASSDHRQFSQGATHSPRIDNKARHITSPYTPTVQQQTLNESLYNACTPQRRQSIIPGPKHNFTASPFPGTAGAAVNSGQHQTTSTSNSSSVTHTMPADCWVTVFGFPQSATSMILSHFSQCGTLVNKMHPQNSGNWMHLRFTSRLECDRALNYNEKILNNFFMVGVTRCKDPAVLELDQRDDLENSSFVGNQQQQQPQHPLTPRNNASNNNNSSIRPLAHIAYKTVQSPTDVVASPLAPTKSTGILDRAMDFFLGW